MNFRSFIKRRQWTSTLANGLAVQTVNSPGEFDAVGIIINTRSAKNPSLALAVEKMIFRGNQRLTEQQILNEFDTIVGTSHQRVNRQNLVIGAALSPDSLMRWLELMGKVLSHPPNKIPFEDLKSSINYDLYELKKKTEVFLPELAVSAAYGPIGASCIDGLKEMDEGCLDEFWSLTMNNAKELQIVSLTNQKHDAILPQINSVFSFLSSADSASSALNHEFKDQDHVYALHDDEQPLTHLVIAFPGIPHDHPSKHQLAVMQRLMGGGGSFSAGGPGKGMYARLYTTVLNRYYWMESAQFFTVKLSDQGLLGIHGSAPPGYCKELGKILLDALHNMTCMRVSDAELSRAKAQVKSAAFMGCESRTLHLDQIANSDFEPYDRFAAGVDAVTLADIQKLAVQLIKGKPVISAFGDVSRICSLDSILK